MKKFFFSLALVAGLAMTSCKHQSPYQVCDQKQIDEICRTADFPMPMVTLPKISDRLYSVMDYGADPTGMALCTEAIQAAIDAANAAGGGTAYIPAGVYTTGPIVLKSNVRLYADHGALVYFSDDFTLYPIKDALFEGLNTKRCQSPISAVNAENIAICGHGTFDGNGYAWRPLKKSKVTAAQWKQKIKKGVVDEEKGVWYPDSASIIAQTYCEDQNVPVLPASATQEDWEQLRSFLRPVLLEFECCKNVLLEGVCFENSPAWNLHPFRCENLILSDVTVRNPWYSQNGDGVDVECCKNVVIDRCSFDVGDDAICMKSGKNEDGRRLGIPTENVCITNCVVYHGHGGFVVGSEMSGGIRNVSVKGCTFIGTDVGLRFKSTRGRGGVVENIWVKDITMADIPNEGLIFNLFYGGKAAGEETAEEIAARMNAAIPQADETTPAFKNITIQNVTCRGAKRCIYFNGLPEQKIENVTLDNIHMTGVEGAIFDQTNGLTVRNLHIECTSGEPLQLSNSVENVVIE
ncbi:MAG: glycoside hydrolase family 28 protein [Paludibacteraceae bacterium]|nr:glycoside hydrolase family 28 protein [Paludibacteraceae bacterium]